LSAPEDITCREIVELVSDYLEGALSPEEHEAFEMHLSYCDGCVNYLDQMRETIRITGELREDSLPPELQSELLRAFADLHLA
jgi:predicted anti-sigma-YlaC factor YlaD